MMNTSPMTLLEEFLLLALNAQTGRFHPIDSAILNRTAASAVLMELALRNRIDYDLRDMFSVDSTPTGDDILDPVINLISQAPVLTPNSTIYWLGKLSDEGEAIVKKGLARLEKRGLVGQATLGFFWMFGMAAQPTVNAAKQNEAKAALLDGMSKDKIPSARNVLLAGLADSCDLFRYILSEDEARIFAPRIAEVSHMDLISQASKSLSTDEPLAAAAGR
ncbi:MAG: GPP34 family phosphoprotein [Alphaproteobacteria bacterium]|nr:GPP34 family phosphoprotein [Alphaproteobacteria bacterium]